MSNVVQLVTCPHCQRPVSQLQYSAHLFRQHSIAPSIPMKFDDEGTLVPCDDCGRADGSHDYEVEH